MSVLSDLQSKIPKHMMPGNVGQNSQVVWPFHFVVEFDLGANPIFSAATRLQKFFQVTQDAGFLLCGISRSSSGFDAGSELAFLGMDLRDRQSSRQFNSTPIPIQAIGRSSKYTRFFDPQWINPGAYVDVTLTSLVNTATLANTSSGGINSKITLTFYGYRMRNPQGINQLGTTVSEGTIKGFDHLGSLRPPNVGNQQAVMWPYFFTTTIQTPGADQIPVIVPGQGLDTSFSVSQEAAFIATHWILTNYLRTGAGPYQYTALDPIAQSNMSGQSPGLLYTLQDPQAGRVFNFNPTPVDFIGQGDFPTELQSPQLLLPNSVFVSRFQNNHPTNVYVPFITFFGYRVRLEDMDSIQSLTTG